MGTSCYIIGVTRQIRKSFGDIADKQEDLRRIRQILRRALPEAEGLQGCKIEKGTIRIPYGKVDAVLIEKIAKWCWQTGNHA